MADAGGPPAGRLQIVVDGERTRFQGETLECEVVITNHNDHTLVVSWCSAQLHCKCMSSRKLKINEIYSDVQPARAASDFAFTPTRGEKGVVIFETEASVLCCDLEIKPGQSCSLPYSTDLPHNAPPSYRGERITCSYKLAIGHHVVGTPVARLCRWPVRVLPINAALSKACRRESAALAGYAEQREAAVGGELSSIAETMLLHHALGLPGEPTVEGAGEPDAPGVSSLAAAVAAAGAAGGDPLDIGALRSPPISGRDSPEIHYKVADAATADGGDARGLTISTEYERGDEGIGGTDDDLPPSATADASAGPAAPRSALAAVNGDSPARLRTPFGRPPEMNAFRRERVLHAISSLSRRRKLSVFKIGSGDTAVVKLYVTKPVFRIGEDVVGWLNFTGATVPCYQVIMALESEETVPAQYWRNPEEAKPHRSTQIHKVVACRHMPMVPIMLPVPVLCAPHFSTKLVSLKWTLSFKFFIESAPPTMETQHPGSLGDTITCAPRKVETQMLAWGLPISVLPSNPSNVPTT